MKINTPKILTLLLVTTAACAPARRPAPVIPLPAVETPPPPPITTSTKLPPVPLVEGPLGVKVIYPAANASIPPVDFNFILGSVGNGRARLWINGVPVPVYPNGAFLGWLPNPKENSLYNLVAALGSDTVRAEHVIRVQVRDTTQAFPADTALRFASPMWVKLGVPDSVRRFVSDTDQVVIGRLAPRGDYTWFLFPETPVQVREYLGSYAKVRLDDNQDAWIERKFIADSTNAPQKRAPTRFSFASAARWVDLNISLPVRVPYLVQEDGNKIVLTLYTEPAATNAQVLNVIKDNYLQNASIQSSKGRTRITITLNKPVYGYLPLWHNGVMTLRLRKPPTVNPTSPLSGLTIVVDAGHPPGGAIGPTALKEPEATLAVALRVQRMLRERGANVVMTRTTDEAVELGLRPIMARRANADALVSVHFNAFADGVNPYRNNGTETYYFHQHSKRLSDLMQIEMLKEMGLRDGKSNYKNLALARPFWFPAVLAEGAYIIMPDQEAAIRTPQYQEAYARAIVQGLEKYFGEL